jgi:adenylate kinase family enzyme
MEKIVIIGSSGAGKSTLAKKLGSMLSMKVYHLDRLFWLRGWIKKDRETRIDILQDLVREKQWIIDGTYLNTSELHLRMADTIIFSDAPSFVCLLRLIKRHNRYRGRSRRDILGESTDKLPLSLMLKVLVFPLRERKILIQKLLDLDSKQIIWLRSLKDVEGLLM